VRTRISPSRFQETSVCLTLNCAPGIIFSMLNGVKKRLEHYLSGEISFNGRPVQLYARVSQPRGIGQLRRVGRLWRWRWWRCLSPLLAFALPTVAGQAEATCHVVAASPPVVAAERVTQISIWRRSRELHRQASVALAVARPWRDDLRTRDFPAGGRFRRARLPRRRLWQLDVLLDRGESQGVPDASTRRVRRCRSVWQRLPRASHSARDLQGRPRSR
jgi:hypothetical protein